MSFTSPLGDGMLVHGRRFTHPEHFEPTVKATFHCTGNEYEYSYFKEALKPFSKVGSTTSNKKVIVGWHLCVYVSFV